MRHRNLGAIVCVAGVLAVSMPLGAASRSRTATATVTVAALAKLSFSVLSLSFPDANPDTVPVIPSAGGAIAISARIRTTPGGPVSLSVLASDDLRSGVATIAISAVQWTATGTGFSAGTMSRTVAQSVGAWVGSGQRTGTQAYTLANSWSHAAGNYTTSFVYTLTAP